MWKLGSMEARFMTRYCASQGVNSTGSLSMSSSAFCCMFIWLRLLKMKATFSWIFSPGNLTSSSGLTLMRAFSSVSMLVVLAMEGRPPTAIGVGRTMALAALCVVAVAAAEDVTAAAACDKANAPMAVDAAGAEVTGCFGPTMPTLDLADGRVTTVAPSAPG